MVIIHIANIDTTVIGGVQIAVPKIVKAQSQYACVGLMNTHGDVINEVQMLNYGGAFNINNLPSPFDKPDLVVFHEIYRFEYIKIYRTLANLNISYIIVPHGCLSRKAQSKKYIKKKVANILFFNGFIKSALAIQYLSDSEQKMSAFTKYRSFVSGNGVMVPIQKKREFLDKGIRFIYVGRLEVHIKGLDLLLEAVKKCELLMRKQSACIEIYGPNYEHSHEQIKQMINKLNVADLIHLDKEKMGKEKEHVLLSADCFIQTSRTEGLPLGPLEAMGYGLPCIVTDGVGLGDIIETFGAGYRCATDADEIAKTIERFIQEIKNIHIKSKAARCLIEEEFDINRIARKTIDKYRNIANK